jgi:N-carbamoyl-L-amino-acid hydrolase
MHMSRRELLAWLAAAGARSTSIQRVATPQSLTNIRIDAVRLQKSLEDLSTHGRPTSGAFADGVSRVAYSDADVAGRAFAMDLMRAAGLEPRIDTAGNIFGRRAGSQPARARILFGSHIDTVPHGGNFDGNVGSMAAIEVMRTLSDRGMTTRHPLEMAIWSNEEGALAGSGIAAGMLGGEQLDRVFGGVRMRDGLIRIGGDPNRIDESRFAPGSFACYLELHIEQGGVLDTAGVPIGVVEGIVSIDDYDVEIKGIANHAGTTPMPERHNALLAAAQMIELVQEVVTREPGRQVGTVGQLDVVPNARNVVPGRVRHTIELRDLSAEKIARLGQEIERSAQAIALRTSTEIVMRKVSHDPPALAAPELQAQIETAAKRLGLQTLRLPSGAGHDAQMMAQLGPIGMIFVPSVGGASHTPKELTRWEDCANGANVLLHTILQIDAA